jgi:hypothetical protein
MHKQTCIHLRKCTELLVFLSVRKESPQRISTAALALSLALLIAGCDRGDVQVYKVAKDTSKTTAAEDPHAGHNHGPGEHAEPTLTWKTPSGWEEVAPSQMRAASFRVKAEQGKSADVSVIPLPGMAGGDLDNVNRWRGQVGLSPMNDEELKKAAEPVTIAGSGAQLYDLAGESPGAGEKTRILGAILRREGVAWFFKMTGADELVAREKGSFKEFLASFGFTEAGQGRSLPPPGNMSSAALPDNHPPIDGATMSQAALPADHPPVGSPAAAQTAASSSGSGKLGIAAPAGWKEVPGGQFLFAKYVIESSEGQTAINVSNSSGDGGGVAGNINRWRGQLGLDQVAPAEVEK